MRYPNLHALDRHAESLFARLDDDERSRDDLARLYAPLVSYLARRFRGRGEPLDDLVQVANVGLLKAIERFDPMRGVRFSAYAAPTIVGELKRHFRDQGWAMRVPRRIQETGLALRSVIQTLSQELGRWPTVAELAKHSGLSEDDVREATDILQAYSVASLEAIGEVEGAAVADRIGDEDQMLEILEGWASIAPLLRRIRPRERRILYLRFVRDMTQSEIAAEEGISQMHVSRLLTRTLARLRDGG